MNPVTELPAQTPTSLSAVVGPVFVTAEPARTEKFAADPRLIAAGPAAFAVRPAIALTAMRSAMPTIATTTFDRFIQGSSLARAHARRVYLRRMVDSTVAQVMTVSSRNAIRTRGVLVAGDEGPERGVVDDQRKERAEECETNERPQPLGASRLWISRGDFGPVLVPSVGSERRSHRDRSSDDARLRHDETVMTGGRTVSVRVSGANFGHVAPVTNWFLCWIFLAIGKHRDSVWIGSR